MACPGLSHAPHELPEPPERALPPWPPVPRISADGSHSGLTHCQGTAAPGRPGVRRRRGPRGHGRPGGQPGPAAAISLCDLDETIMLGGHRCPCLAAVAVEVSVCRGQAGVSGGSAPSRSCRLCPGMSPRPRGRRSCVGIAGPGRLLPCKPTAELLPGARPTAAWGTSANTQTCLTAGLVVDAEQHIQKCVS